MVHPRLTDLCGRWQASPRPPSAPSPLAPAAPAAPAALAADAVAIPVGLRVLGVDVRVLGVQVAYVPHQALHACASPPPASPRNGP